MVLALIFTRECGLSIYVKSRAVGILDRKGVRTEGKLIHNVPEFHSVIVHVINGIMHSVGGIACMLKSVKI